MNVYLSSSYKRSLQKLTKKNSALSLKILEKIAVFTTSPSHPSLALHKLTGTRFDTWSFSIAPDIRILFSYIENGVLFIDIGKHEEVY